jgi:hypothetical protein
MLQKKKRLHMQRALTAASRYAGVSLTPSVARVSGRRRKKARMVIMEKRLMLCREPCREVSNMG